MDLLPTEEQNQIVDVSVDFLSNELPVDRIHGVNEDNPLIDREILARVAELGWFGIGLAEEHGGVGYGLREETLLFVELGRFLASPVVLGNVLGARVAVLSGNNELAAEIVAGEKMVAVAVASYVQTPSITDTVSGEFYVFEGGDADLVLIPDENGIALVEKSAISIFQPQRCMDEKVQMAAASLEHVSTVAYVPSSKENIFLRGVVLTAAMQLGVAEATLERSVEYAKVREQYGKPIGSFQAIKHYCAEMAVKCESVKSTLYIAAIALDDFLNGKNTHHGDNYRFDSLCAKALASEAAQDNANTAVQIHGGMGFTQEMDIHLFVKRAHVQDQLFGGKRKQLQNLIKQSGPVL